MKLKILMLLGLTVWTGIINTANHGPRGLAGLLEEEPANSFVYQRVNPATHQPATSTRNTSAPLASIPEESDYYSSTDEDEQDQAQQQPPRKSKLRKFNINASTFNAIQAVVQNPDIMVNPTYCQGFSTLSEAQQKLLTKEFDEKIFNLTMTLIKLQDARLVTPTEVEKTNYIFLLPKSDEYQETLDPFRLDGIKQILKPEIEQKAVFDAAVMELMIQNIANGTLLPEKAIDEIHSAYHEQFHRKVSEIDQRLNSLVEEHIANIVNQDVTLAQLEQELQHKYLRHLMIKALEEHNQINPDQKIEHNLTQ